MAPNTENFNMRSRGSVAVFVSLATLVASLAAKVEAQEFQIEEASSVAGLSVGQLNPKTIAFIDRPFTVDAGELTPTLKVRRSIVEAKFRERIDQLYAA